MFAVAESLQSKTRRTVWNQSTTRCQDVIASTGHLIVYNPLPSAVRRMCYANPGRQRNIRLGVIFCRHLHILPKILMETLSRNVRKPITAALHLDPYLLTPVEVGFDELLCRFELVVPYGIKTKGAKNITLLW